MVASVGKFNAWVGQHRLLCGSFALPNRGARRAAARAHWFAIYGYASSYNAPAVPARVRMPIMPIAPERASI